MRLMVPSPGNSTLKSKVVEALQVVEPLPAERRAVSQVEVIELIETQWLICCMKMILIVAMAPRFVWFH